MIKSILYTDDAMALRTAHDPSTKPLKQLAREGESFDQVPVGHQVPLSRILETEFKALGIPEQEIAHICAKYETYVTGMMNAVSVWLGFGEAKTADKRKLAEAVRNRDEKELFYCSCKESSRTCSRRSRC